jgi:aminoglycoside phosphotransferase (APT) family kinase protein
LVKHQQSNSQTIEMNWGKIESYIRSNLPLKSEEPMKIIKFPTGYSNLTYFISIGDWEAVLRQPPNGYIPAKAHDMEREYTLLSNLYKVFPYAPQPYLYCNDRSIHDRHFYIMEKKKGLVIDDTIPSEYKIYGNRIGLILSEAVINTLSLLHEIDYKAAGLHDFGRPQGYLQRQVTGWIGRYQRVKTEEITGIEKLEEWLISNIPESPSPTIVHNDFKINNLMFSPRDPSIVTGVLDWEMCTIGDPLTDLGSSLAYWTAKGEADTGLTSVTHLSGFLSRRELCEIYARKTGRDVSNIDYYLTFAFYKIAVILQQIYYRWKQGHAEDSRFEQLNTGIANLIQQAFRAKQKELL